MKKILIVLALLLPTLAHAQSNRNPCIYLNTSNNNCQSVGSSTNGVGNSPMPVGGLATVVAPTYVQGMMGGLSFDLAGNLRVTTSSGGGAVTIADGADVAEGATTDTASMAGGIGTVSSKLRLMTTQLGTINTTLGSPFQAGGALAANQSVNASQINGITPLMGNGITGTGSQRVTIASDNTAFSVNATLSAETTKVIGAVNQGTSPWVASAIQSGTWNITNVSGTVSLPTGAATSALQSTINTTLGSPLQAGGTVVVTGVATAANQSTMATNQTVVQASVAPATATATKSNLIGCQYNSTDVAFTNGQQGQVGCDQRGGLYVQDGKAIASVSVNSATTLFTVTDTSGYGSISVQVTSAGSATITYEASEDGTTWSAVNGYTPGANTGNIGYSTSTGVTLGVFSLSAKQFRARVSAYTSGTVTVQGTLRKDQISRQAISVLGNLNDGGSSGAFAVGTVFEARTTNKTAVTTGQYVRPIATSIGAAVNKPFQVPELDWSYPAAAGGISNTTTAVTMVAAAGVGIRNYLTAIQLSAPTLGAATEVAVRDGAGGTVIWRGFMSTAGGNQSVNLSSPVKSTANTLLEVVTLSATVTGAVYINAQGYQAP